MTAPAPAVEGTARVYPCSGCGKFAFNVPTTCYWCLKGIPSEHLKVAAPKMRTIEDVRRAANARKHRCTAYLCIAQVDGDRIMCEPHMAMLPPWLNIKLEQAHNPAAVEPWPRELVEEAIRFTMPEAQMAAMLDVPNQREMFSPRTVAGR